MKENLLKARTFKNVKSIMNQVYKYILTLFIVPDDIVIDLVKERLSKPDCTINGWILDGAPASEE